MRLCLISESVDDQLLGVSRRSGLSAGEVAGLCKGAGGRYWKFVLRQWFLGNILLPAGGDYVREVLGGFERLKSGLAVKDIGRYASFVDLERVVKRSRVRSFSGLDGVDVVRREGDLQLVSVGDVESLKDLGMGTRWCTRRDFPDCRAVEYLRRYSKIFIAFEGGLPVLQFSPDYKEMNDRENKSIIPQGSFDLAVQKLVGGVDGVARLLEFVAPDLQEDSFEVVLNYCKHVGRWGGLERFLVEHGNYGGLVRYALEIVRGPLIAAERVLLSELHRRLGLPQERGELVLGEPEMVFKKGEQTFWSVLVRYANILRQVQGGWPDVERELLESGNCDCVVAYTKAVAYAKAGLERRWPEAERLLLAKGDVRALLLYARDVVGERWLEAEPIIVDRCGSPFDLVSYARFLVRGRWPEAEAKLSEFGDEQALADYRAVCNDVVVGDWELTVELDGVEVTHPESGRDFVVKVLVGANHVGDAGWEFDDSPRNIWEWELLELISTNVSDGGGSMDDEQEADLLMMKSPQWRAQLLRGLEIKFSKDRAWSKWLQGELDDAEDNKNRPRGWSSV